MKPRLKKTRYKGWVCIGGGISCHGETIGSAFEEWNHMYTLISRQISKEKNEA